MPPSLTPDLNSLLEARHHDPFGWLGQAPPAGRHRHRPGAAPGHGQHRRSSKPMRPMQRVGADRSLRVAGTCPVGARALPPAGRRGQRPGQRGLRPLLLRAPARRGRRSPPSTAGITTPRTTSWAPTPGRSTASPACASRSGPPMPERVSVVGDFNRWDGRCHPMRVRGASGVWELFIPGLRRGALQVRDPQPALGRAAPEDGSLRPRARAPAGHRLAGFARRPRSAGRTTPGWRGGAPGTGCTSPCPSTKCTSAPGGAIPTAAR